MTSKVIIEPVGMAVSLISARNSSRLNGTDHDAEIEIEVRAITVVAEHYTGRKLITQTHEIALDAFPRNNSGIKLPASPCQSIVSINYWDVDGVQQTLDPTDYLIGANGTIMPASDVTWPETQAQVDAVTVVVVLGYGDDEASVPSGFKSFILGRIQEHFAPPGTTPSPYLIGKIQPYKDY